MSHFLRHTRTSVLDSVSVNIFSNLGLFGTLKYSTLKFLPRNKVKQWHRPRSCLPIKKNGLSTTIFTPKKESCKEKGQNHTYLESSKHVQLSEILGCSEEEAYNLYQTHNHLTELNSLDLKTRIEKLEQYGIDTASIKQNICVLFFNENRLSATLELLKKWKFTNLNNVLSIFQVPFTKLKKLTLNAEKDFQILDGQNKITYFSSFVKCHEKRACDLFVKCPFMMTINPEVLKAILTMTKDIGVLTEDLLSDPWLFRYSVQFIANRVRLLDEIYAKDKCKTIKPWMLRCPHSTLDRYFELKDENIAALGSYTNLKDLLTNELDLSDMEVEEMFFKHPPLAKISYSKAKEMIDFLKAEGFGSKMIHQVPRVLCHKQATLLARILELKKVNPRMMSLQNLCRNKKDYLAFLNKVQHTHS